MNANLNIEMMEWAIERNGLATADLLRIFPRLGGWLSGEASPTMKQLEKFAHRVHIPMPYFFGSVYPNTELPIPDYRTVSNAHIAEPSLDLLETIETLSHRLDWLSEYRKQHGHRPLYFIGAQSGVEDAAALAQATGEVLGLDAEWAFGLRSSDEAVRLFRQRLADLGVIVSMTGKVGMNTHRPLSVEEFRGFVLSDAYAPFIFVNSRDSKKAQLFTLAHEFIHLMLDRTGLFNSSESHVDKAQGEKLCNDAAAIMLVRPDSLLALWSTDARFQTDASKGIISASKMYKVSSMVIARRLYEDTLITDQQFDEFLKLYKPVTERRVSPKGGGDSYTTHKVAIGAEFARTVHAAAESGELPYIEAFRLTGMSPKMYDGYFARNGAFR